MSRITDLSPPAFCPWCGTPSDGEARCSICREEMVDRRVGTVLVDRYRIERLLAEGGMGRVYRATQLALGEPVVVKFLLSEAHARPEVRARFQREAIVLARLRHPGVVSVIDYGEVDGTPYLVMELVRGEPLITYERTRPEGLTLADIELILGQILDVLDVAHAQGIVHRDLKPENVMLVAGTDGGIDHVKVLDFGVALVLEGDLSPRLTAADVVQGTPLYMSPEQCHGRAIGPPADIYAVGTMLYEMLAGETPFSGSSVSAIMAKQLYSDPPPIRRPVLPGLEALARRALAKDAAERPTARELKAELALAIRQTDVVGAQIVASTKKAIDGGKSRSERAFGPASAPPPAPSGDTPASERPRVAMVGLEASHDALLDAAFAVNRLRPTSHAATVTPDALAGAAAIVVPHGHASMLLTQLRAHAATAQTPVLVIEVPNADAVAALIRAGASDAALGTTPDAVLCRQVWRLVRRRR